MGAEPRRQIGAEMHQQELQAVRPLRAQQLPGCGRLQRMFRRADARLRQTDPVLSVHDRGLLCPRTM